MSRKTSGALQIQLQTVVQAMEEAISKLIEKVDTLGGKIDKMPSIAKKMADGYVASFGTIAKSVEGLSSHINKLDKIASGLTKIAASVKGFKATENQAAAFDRLTKSFTALGPAVAAFPKDVSGLSTFADSIKSITTAMSGLEGHIPTSAKIDRLNRAANAIRNTANSLKSVGTLPSDAKDMLQALNSGGGTGGSGGGGGGGGGGTNASGPSAESSEFKQYATKGISVLLSLGISEALKRQNVDKELSHVMAYENPNLGALIPGADGSFKAPSNYTARIKQEIAANQLRHGVNYEDAMSTMAMTARYTYGGNRGYSDVRDMDPAARLEQQSNIIANSKEMYQKTGLDLSTATNMQLAMGRDLGVKATEYTKLKDAFIVVQRAGSLAARDLEKLSANARDSGMALNLMGDEASSYITERLKSATALANAGIKASNTQGAMAGFFGDEKSFIFDMLAGITDADYKKGNEANLLKKQYAGMNQFAGSFSNTAAGNLGLGMLMREIAPASMQGGPEQYRTVSARMGEVGRQQELIDSAVKLNASFDPLIPTMDQLSIAGQRLWGVLTGITAAVGYGASAGQATVAPDKPGGQLYNPVNPAEAMMWSNPMLIPLRAGKLLYDSIFGEKPAKHAQGGVVRPGASGATDSVPIMATPGEEVLNASDPRHRNNIGAFAKSFAQIEGYYAKGDKLNRPQRNLNPGNLRVYGWSPNMSPEVALEHARTQGAIGYDPQGYLKFASESAGFAGLHRQIAIDAKRGMNVANFIEKYAPATENNTAAYKEFIRKKGFSGNLQLAEIGGNKSSAPMLADGTAGISTALTSLAAAQKVQQQSTVQLDPAAMNTLMGLVGSNSESSDTMAQAVAMFAQLIQRLSGGSRFGGQDLTEAVARGNYAFSRGA